jgi:hypothetical protein
VSTTFPVNTAGATSTLVKQVDLGGAVRGIQESAKPGLEGKSKLHKSGYDEGQCMNWNAALHPAEQQTMHRLY